MHYKDVELTAVMLVADACGQRHSTRDRKKIMRWLNNPRMRVRGKLPRQTLRNFLRSHREQDHA